MSPIILATTPFPSMPGKIRCFGLQTLENQQTKTSRRTAQTEAGGRPACSLWRAAEWQSWPQCPWNVLCALPQPPPHPCRALCRSRSAEMLRNRHSNDVSPKSETEFKRKNLTLTYLTCTHEAGARSFQIPIILLPCTPARTSCTG